MWNKQIYLDRWISMNEIIEEGDPVIEDIDIEDESIVHNEIEEIDEDEFEE